MELLNLATFIALLIVALQYIINNFLADTLKNYYWCKKYPNDENMANIKRNDFVKMWSWVILILFIIAILLGTIGLLRE